MKLASLFCLFFLATTISFSQQQIDPSTITIARDEWEVPHIFAPTDAGVAYGLAWANAEDHFDEMQELLLSGKGMMGREKGVEGAAVDFFVHLIGAKELVDKHYESDITPAFKQYLEGYCQGINAFAKKHPKQVRVKKTFPITPKDILTSYVIGFSALSGVADEVEKVFKGKYTQVSEPKGSNAFAINSTRTVDGATYLCINPHLLLEGPFSFYEAHLQSEEGLNITGTIFQGGTSIYMGNNEHLGWGKTFNHFDRVDVYQLEMHPKKKRYYKFDGKYLKLKKRPVWLKVKVKGVVLPVRRKAYWSKLGPVLQSPKDGKFYAINSLAFRTILAAQQYYYMNKATNFKEFQQALEMQGIPMFNIVYADKEDNIYYLHNGLLPKRSNVEVNWGELLPGNSSKYHWTTAYPTSELPQVLNPDCGYVFNTNNTPFNATCKGQNDDPKRLPTYVDLRPGNNNRAERFMELIKEQEQFSFEEFKALKFDDQFPKHSAFLSSVQALFQLDTAKYPQIKKSIVHLKNWNKSGHYKNKEATIFALCVSHLMKKKGVGDAAFVSGLKNLTEEEAVAAVTYAQNHLLTHFGSLEVEFQELNRFFTKDGKDYPSAGFVDLLNVSYSYPHQNGRFKVKYGDTYIHFVRFGKNGAEQIETLLPYKDRGDGDVRELSLYNNKKTKRMSLDKDEILQQAKRVYSPNNK